MNTGEHMTKTSTFSVRLPDELRQEVAKIAQKQKRSSAFIIKEAVEEYVAEKIAYYNAIDEALEDVANGKTISGDEFFSKLNGLRNRNKKVA
jgi:predicted transcriptional regulator